MEKAEQMAEEFTPIAELTDATTDWLLLVRINRIYLNTRPGMNPRNANLDCVAIDADGQQIHIEIDRDLIQTYRDILREGEIYIISNFYVVPVTRYEPVTRGVKVEFMMGTRVIEYNGPPVHIPDFGFEFLEFDEIPNYLGDNQFLIDVIGLLQGIRETELSPTKFGRSSRTNIELQDVNQQIAKVTLWSQCSDDFLNSNIRATSEPVVLIVTSLTVKRLQGVYRLSTTPASRFYANLDHEAVRDFRSRIQGHIQVPQLLPPEPTGRPRRVIDENEQALTVEQLLALPRSNIADRQFRTIAQIQHFEPGNGWFYDGCPDCTRKLRDSTATVNCGHCGAKNVKGVPIYKLEAKMTDGSASVIMIFFSNVAEHIVGIPIQILQNQQFTIRRRIPKIIANLAKSKWELQICVNNKSLASPQLIFNVNRVLRRITGDDALTTSPMLQAPPVLLLENALPRQNSNFPTFGNFPSVAEAHYRAQLHSYAPSHWHRNRGSNASFAQNAPLQNPNAEQSALAKRNGQEPMTAEQLKANEEYEAAAKKKGKRAMTAEECLAAEKKAKCGPIVRKQLFLAPPTVKPVDPFSDSLMQPIAKNNGSQEINSYIVETPLEEETAQPVAIGFQMGTITVMPELHTYSRMQAAQNVNQQAHMTTQYSRVHIDHLGQAVTTRPIEPSFSGNNNTMAFAIGKTESVGESLVPLTTPDETEKRKLQEEHDKRFWDDLKNAGYTAEELEEANLFIKDSDEDNQDYHTPPQVPEAASPKNPSN